MHLRVRDSGWLEQTSFHRLAVARRVRDLLRHAFVVGNAARWRLVKGDDSDGVTNVFSVCCEARANGLKVHVNADADSVFTVQLA